jgi:hypothetical protein
MTAPFTDLQQALSKRAAKMLSVWPPAMGPVPLCDAHRLLDQPAIEEALATCMVARAKQYGLTSLPRRNGNYIFPLFPALLPYLRQWVIDRLTSGRMVAKGLDPVKVLSGKPTILPAGRIKLLVIDWERSTASINGAVVACEVSVDVRPERSALPGRQVASRAAVAKWLSNRCKTGRVPDQNKAFTEARNAFPKLFIDREWFRGQHAQHAKRRRGRPGGNLQK